MSSKLSLQYIGEGVNSGENERLPYFDFDGQSSGFYFCFNTGHNSTIASMCIAQYEDHSYYGKHLGAIPIGAYVTLEQGTTFTTRDDTVLVGISWKWYSTILVYKILGMNV